MLTLRFSPDRSSLLVEADTGEINVPLASEGAANPDAPLSLLLDGDINNGGAHLTLGKSLMVGGTFTGGVTSDYKQCRLLLNLVALEPGVARGATIALNTGPNAGEHVLTLTVT